MGLLQAALRTYETQAHRAGCITAEEKEPLTPLSHIVQNAQVEVTITDDGRFEGAQMVSKDDSKTIIPATMKSAGRAGKDPYAHPLCDKIGYFLPENSTKHALYCDQLKRWAESDCSHPKVQAVWQYIQRGSIRQDLTDAGLITPHNADKSDNWFVRWRVIPAPEGESSACWQDVSLFDCFIRYYAGLCRELPRGICMLSGKEDVVCTNHAKGTVSLHGNAKLISANDSSGFTYRGRFTKPDEALSIGYEASQKAHNALRWVVANQGVLLGGRAFVCWNPEGAPVQLFPLFTQKSDRVNDFPSYRQALRTTLGGYRQNLKPEADVIIASMDAATTGRLSVTYYNELKGSDYLDRVENWYETLCWNTRAFGVQSPPIRQIVLCAFGKQAKSDDKTPLTLDGNSGNVLFRTYAQQLLHCMVDHKPISSSIVRALVANAGNLLAYNKMNREKVLEAACAVVRKVHNDRTKKEEWILEQDKKNTNRSYLFGQLLALYDFAERSTFNPEIDKKRETNAIRLQSAFIQQPLHIAEVLNKRLQPYYRKLSWDERQFYKISIASLLKQIYATCCLSKINTKLDDVYLLGYASELTELFNKQSKNKLKENNYEQLD